MHRGVRIYKQALVTTAFGGGFVANHASPGRYLKPSQLWDWDSAHPSKNQRRAPILSCGRQDCTIPRTARESSIRGSSNNPRLPSAALGVRTQEFTQFWLLRGSHGFRP